MPWGTPMTFFILTSRSSEHEAADQVELGLPQGLRGQVLERPQAELRFGGSTRVGSMIGRS